MAQYIVSMLAKESHGWSEIVTTQMQMSAQANHRQLTKDVIENTQDRYSDDDVMDDGMINRAADQLDNSIEDIDGDDLVMPEVKSILHNLLDCDQVDIEAIDVSEFVDVVVNVNTRALHDEIKENRLITEMEYTVVFDALGTIMYEVHDPDNVLVGRVIVIWLEG